MPKREPNATESWRVLRIMSEFVEGFETMASVGPAVSIFGSARTPVDDPYYAAARAVAAKLAERRLAVITGGGPGIMQAANQGAKEAGGTSIGLNIRLPNEQAPNRYQTIELHFRYFYARKVMFVKYASAMICFPGGFGTMDELFELLTLVQTRVVEPVPVVFFGTEFWSGLVAWLKGRMFDDKYISPGDTDIFRITDDVDECVRWVADGMEEPWWGDRASAITTQQSPTMPTANVYDVI